MSSEKTHTGPAALCLAVALLTGLVAAAGIALRGDGSAVQVVSVRGEAYAMATTGLYAFNAQRVVAEGVGWDVFTLLFAVPALLAAVPALRRGSFRVRLFALGLLAYLFYQYLMYAVTWAFGLLFLPFIIIYAASLGGIVWLGAGLAREDLASRFSERFPRRGMAVLCVGLALMLVAMWLHRIVAALRGDLGGAMLLGQTTMVVQALDLGLVVPLALLTAVTVWRARPIGYVLSSVLVVKAVAMAAAICAMLLAAWRVEGRLEVVPFAIFAGAAVTAAWLGTRMYRSTRLDAASRDVPPRAGTLTTS
ncbi:Hypothetical protein A7982_04353 [Minicystis rosea]|nr:Hypothetical protein A7982_04353 [Minicystis rosea]